MSNLKRRLLIGSLIALGLGAAVTIDIGQAGGFNETMKSEQFFIESVDSGDPEAIRRWASELCTGMSVADAAVALDVPPTLEAVVQALTGSLPAWTRAEAARVCRERLRPLPDG